MVSFEYDGRTVSIDHDPEDHIYKQIVKKQTFYELEMLEYIKQLNASGTYIDVGANIGNHSIFLALLPQCSRVLAFEPYEVVYKYLLKNIKANGLSDKIIARPLALGARPGEAGIVPGEAGNLGMTKLNEKGSGATVDTLDNQTAGERVGVIKIDVEGFEPAVLKGAKKLLAAQAPHLFIEAATEKQKQAIDNLLEPLGYHARERFNVTPTYHYQKRRGLLGWLRSK